VSKRPGGGPRNEQSELACGVAVWEGVPREHPSKNIALSSHLCSLPIRAMMPTPIMPCIKACAAVSYGGRQAGCTDLDGWRRIKERRVEVKAVLHGLLRDREEEQTVVHVGAYAQHACRDGDSTRHGCERKARQRKSGTMRKHGRPRKKQTEERTAA
jgi:hypothetical protein